MRNYLKSALLLLILTGLLQACGMFRDKDPEYLASEDGEPLVLPEGLDTPRPVTPIVIRIAEMRTPSGDELNPLPPRAATTAGGGEANTFIAWSASGAYLAVNDTPESVSRRMRFTIERSGMNLLERDDENGHQFEYFQQPQVLEKSFWGKIKFWSKDYAPNYSGSYRLRLEPDGDNTRVYLKTITGESTGTNAAEHVLGIFMERLG
ncbi:MAG: putative lipoprotein [Lysobacterales bacterium]|jgi:uncharacterized lipoprotein